MRFRTALLCSGLFHVGFMGLTPPAAWVPSKHSLNTLEVFYLAVPAGQEAVVRPPSAAAAGPKARAVQAPVSPPAAQKRVAALPLAPADAAPLRPAPSPASKPTPRPQAAAPTPKAAPPLPATGSVAGASGSATTHSGSVSVPEQEFASVEHKERVRRHLKAHLSYPSFLADGTVRIGLLLGPSGALREVRIVEASDPRLADVALQDARKAAPYPRFTQPMRETVAAYEFLIRYQPEER